jgi:hypothetical protein
MKFLKYLGYYLLLVIYFLFVFAVQLFTYNSPYGYKVDAAGILISLCIIASPFILVARIIDKFYPGNNPKRHAYLLITTIVTLWFFHALGGFYNNGFDISYLPMYTFDACLIISLYLYYRSKPDFKSNTIVIRERWYKKIRIKTIKWPVFKIAKPNKRAYFIMAACFLILMIGNPSITAFKAYQGASSYGGLKRKYNFFIFSIYECNSGIDAWGNERDNGSSVGGEYFGILGNFFRI